MQKKSTKLYVLLLILPVILFILISILTTINHNSTKTLTDIVALITGLLLIFGTPIWIFKIIRINKHNKSTKTSQHNLNDGKKIT